MFGVVAIITQVSVATIYSVDKESGAVVWPRAAAHVAVGVVCLGVTVVLVYTTHGELLLRTWKQLRE